MKILIVEDESDSRIFLERRLQKEGHTVVSAVDGVEGLESARKTKPDIVISDIMMPEMDGFELCRRMKADGQLRIIPFIFYTATFIDRKDEQLAMDLGGERFIVKPIEIDRLLEIITEVVETHKEKKPKTPDKSQKSDEVLTIRYAESIARKLDKKVKELEEERQAMQQNEQFLNAIVENIPDMIFVKDAEDLKFVRLNKAGEDLLGYSREELIGKSDYDFFPKDDSDFFTEKDREVLAKGMLLDIEEEVIRTKYKGRRILHTKKIPIINEKGQPEYLLGISEDITERKHAAKEKTKLEDQLRQAQKMEAIGTLAGGIAHDFNNILSVIIGNAEIAQYDIPEEGPLRYSMDQVIKAGYRARDLVKQILAFSRQNEPELRPVRVSLIVKEVLKLLRSSLPSTIEIRQEIAAEKDSIMADPTQIHQILMNLCTNAQHAMREKGGILDVTLTDEYLDVESVANHTDLEPGKFLKLSVSDTGHGMTADIMEQIFDPYFTTKEKDVGTGLGLSVIHGIINSCKGSITVQSEPGKGARFEVLFPCVDSDVGVYAQGIAPIPRGNERIMFIDDELAICDIGKRMLQDLGYEVDIRSSSIEALEAFKQHPERYDIIITDLTMPNMTGDKLAQTFLNIRPDIPIILCTGFSEKVTERKVKELGVKGFVMKPLVMREIAELIRKVLDKKIDPV